MAFLRQVPLTLILSYMTVLYWLWDDTDDHLRMNTGQSEMLDFFNQCCRMSDMPTIMSVRLPILTRNIARSESVDLAAVQLLLSP